jgi:RNA-directed DNA polymerase
VASHAAKRHKRARGYGWSVLAFQSPDRLGLIDLNGIVVAAAPTSGMARVKPNARGEERR